MKKRVLAMILGICLTAGAISGCGRKADEGRTSNTSRDMSEKNREDGRGDTRDELNSGAHGGETEAEGGDAGADGSHAAADSGTAAMQDMYEPEQYLYDVAPSENDGFMLREENIAVMPPYNEEYTGITENAFISAATQPLSTFSADVDTASYSNLRRMIMSGYTTDWIPKDSVRIEELLNYFSYDYRGPRAGEAFGVNTEIVTCPWNRESYLLRIGLQTEAVDFSEAAPSNLVFLIDVSGSMYSADKLPLLQQSFSMLASNLTAKDRVSIVTYAGKDKVILTGAKGNETDRIVGALNALEAGGSTNGSAGIETAYEIAQEYFIEGGNNRVILATDGDLNVGLTTVSELERLVSEKKQTGIFLSVLGFGTGNLKDNRMEALADKGNGNYAYIDSLSEARKVLVEEMGATLVTVAKDVKLQMEFDSDVVSEYRLIGYENRALAAEDFADDTKDAGEIGAGHSVTALYEIKPAGSFAAGASIDGSVGTLHIRYKEPDGNRSRQFDYEIGEEQFSRRPSDDFRFAACVAGFGMVLRGSEYCGDLKLEDILAMLNGVDVSGDEYKAEFVQLVKTLMENNEW